MAPSVQLAFYANHKVRFGSVQFRSEQISAVTDPVPEQRRSVRTIFIDDVN